MSAAVYNKDKHMSKFNNTAWHGNVLKPNNGQI